MRSLKVASVSFAVLISWSLLHFFDVLPTGYYKEFYHFYGKHLRYYPGTYIHRNKLEKWLENPPQWAVDQVEADLSAFPRITPEMLDDAYKKNYNYHNQLVRIQVIKRHVYVTDAVNTSITPVRTFLAALSYLAKRRLIPDCEFIMSFQDFVSLKSTSSVPIFTFSKDLQVDVEKDLILVPNWMNLKAWPFMEKVFRHVRGDYPWEKRTKKLFWRGFETDSTGHCHQFVSYAKKSAVIDAVFVGYNSPFCYAPTVDHLRYAYQVNIDGARCAWDPFVWQLNSGSVVFKGPSKQIQWFYRGVQPGVHYLDLPHTQVELEATLKSLSENQEKAQSYREKALEFGQENLQIEHMYGYIALLLNRYAKRLEKGVKRVSGMQKF